jgi:hypothetical protein
MISIALMVDEPIERVVERLTAPAWRFPKVWRQMLPGSSWPSSLVLTAIRCTSRNRPGGDERALWRHRSGVGWLRSIACRSHGSRSSW